MFNSSGAYGAEPHELLGVQKGQRINLLCVIERIFHFGNVNNYIMAAPRSGPKGTHSGQKRNRH